MSEYNLNKVNNERIEGLIKKLEDINKINEFYEVIPSLLETLVKEFNATSGSLMLVKNSEELFDYFTPKKYQGKYLERIDIYSEKKTPLDNEIIYASFPLESIVSRAKRGPSSFKFILEGRSYQLCANENYIKELVSRGYLNPHYFESEKERYEKMKANKAFRLRYPTFEHYLQRLTIPLKTKEGKIYGILSLDGFKHHDPKKLLKKEFIRDCEEVTMKVTFALANALERVNANLKEKVEIVKKKLEELARREIPPYTYHHSLNVANLSINFARYLENEEKITPYEIFNLYYGALLHDIGKSKIPSEILNKPGKLTLEEFEVIKKHPRYGYEMVNEINFPKEAKEIVLYHHEREDGSGYYGLKGNEIPKLVKIISIIDIFDALLQTRSYRPGLKLEEAIKTLEKIRGLNPKYLEKFLEFIEKTKKEIDKISKEEKNHVIDERKKTLIEYIKKAVKKKKEN